MNTYIDVTDLLPENISRITQDTRGKLTLELVSEDGFLEVRNQPTEGTLEWKDQQRKLHAIISGIGKSSNFVPSSEEPSGSSDDSADADYSIYILRKSSDDRTCVAGFLKFSYKRLILQYKNMKINQLTLCLIDFSVVQVSDEEDLDLKLFKTMLKAEKCQARNLAYYMPSKNMLNFLEKNFKLSAPLIQSGKLYVFPEYFKECVSRNYEESKKSSPGESSKELLPKNCDIVMAPQSHQDGQEAQENMSEGQAAPQNGPQGQAAAENVQAAAENIGQAAAENIGQAAAENIGQAAAENIGQAAAINPHRPFREQRVRRLAIRRLHLARQPAANPPSIKESYKKFKEEERASNEQRPLGIKPRRLFL